MSFIIRGKRENREKENLSDIRQGEPFKFGGKYYVKLDQRDFATEMDVLSLNDNEITRIDRWVEVKPVDLLIEEEIK